MRQLCLKFLKYFDKEKVIIVPGKGKTSYSILSDEFGEEQVFPHLLPKGKFGCNASRDIQIVKGCWGKISILFQMQIVYCLTGMCMSSKT